MLILGLEVVTVGRRIRFSKEYRVSVSVVAKWAKVCSKKCDFK